MEVLADGIFFKLVDAHSGRIVSTEEQLVN